MSKLRSSTAPTDIFKRPNHGRSVFISDPGHDWDPTFASMFRRGYIARPYFHVGTTCLYYYYSWVKVYPGP